MSKKNQQGFTLVEMAIILMIAGFILVAFIMAYQVYVKNAQQSSTVTNEKQAKEAINTYYFSLGRYPCPASATANTGLEVCAGLPAIGTCSNGICAAAGRDADNDGALDPVYIGTIPYATLSTATLSDGSPLPNTALSKVQAMDGWNRKLMYAVSGKLINNLTFNAGYGSIDVVDEKGIDVLGDPTTAHYVLYSAGDNGAGAYSNTGALYAPCLNGAVETENCNNDNKFVSSLRYMAPGAGYNDDILTFSSISASSLWSNTLIDPGAASNTNLGNVGIGTTTPTQPLDVKGSLHSIMAYTKLLCDTAGQNCYDPNIIGGAGASGCGQNSAMISIGRVNAGAAQPTIQCAPVITAPIDVICTTGYMTGVTIANGVAKAVCKVP